MRNYRKPHPSSPSLIAFLISLIPVSLYPAVSAVITIDSRSYTVPFQRSFRLSCTYALILPGMTSSQLAGTYSGNVKSAGLILYLFRYCSVTFSFTRLQSVSVCSPVRPYSLISSEDSPFSACHRSGIHLSAPCPPSLKNMQTSVSPLPIPELQLQFFSSSLFLQFVYFSGLLFRTSTKVENVSVLQS